MDGNELCQTPCSRSLTEGSHIIETRLRRYAVDRRTLEVAPRALHDVTLTPLFAVLLLDSTPSDLRVAIDGEFAGKTPITAELDPGTYTITLDEDAWLPSGVELSLRAAETKSLDLPAIARRGALRVEVPDGAGNDLASRVEVDGRPMGTSPWSGSLQVGTHRVTAAGHDRTVVVYESKVTPLEIVVVSGAEGRQEPIEDADLWEIPPPRETNPGTDRERTREADRERGPWRLQDPGGRGGFLIMGEVIHLSGGSAGSELWVDTVEDEEPTEDQQAALDDLAGHEEPTIDHLAPLSIPVLTAHLAMGVSFQRLDAYVGLGKVSGGDFSLDGLHYNYKSVTELGVSAGLQGRVRMFKPYVEYRFSSFELQAELDSAAGPVYSSLGGLLHGPRVGVTLCPEDAAGFGLDLNVSWLPGPGQRGFAAGLAVGGGAL